MTPEESVAFRKACRSIRKHIPNDNETPAMFEMVVIKIVKKALDDDDINFKVPDLHTQICKGASVRMIRGKKESQEIEDQVERDFKDGRLIKL